MRTAFRHALALTAFVSFAAACDHWPGVDDNHPGGGFPVETSGGPGTCSGMPLACGALGGDTCSSTAGCSDHGSCVGTPTGIGQTCTSVFSAQSCATMVGCFWAPNCVGTPLGGCVGATQAACTAIPGCVFAPSGTSTGSGGNSGLCTTFSQTCTSAGNCDCGFSCVQSCATCRAACGTPCISDGDCTGSMGTLGTATPFCVGVPSPPTTQFTGMCQSSR